jgi:SAM-dependent methyltransferase
MGMSEPGLDYAFLQFIGATPESQKHWQRFYVPMFAGCHDVLDLGCGSGDFLEMAAEQGARVHGVDLDPQCCADARGRGLSIDCSDVLEYLRGAAPDQFDGVFCAHLIEHLPYSAVLEVVRGIMRVLRPGGRVVLVTPNASSLFAHLEMYYRHFGHVSFYHPELLRFFLHHAEFTDIATGTNPTMGTGATWGMRLRSDVSDAFPYDQKTDRAITFTRRLPVYAPGVLGWLAGRIKQALATWIVLPYMDEITASANARTAALGNGAKLAAEHLVGALERIDPPWECYAAALKPRGAHAPQQ